jgi:hypothetical protein
MATRWGAVVGELSSPTPPTALGLSCQPSVTEVNAAHAEVTAFTGALAAQVGARTTHVAEAASRYTGNETRSADQLAAVAHPVTSV